jgi:hypothetical protein
VARRVYQPAPGFRFPGWLRTLLLVLLPLLLALLAFKAWHEAQRPQSLSQSTLAGARTVGGPVCIEEAVDVSGSMSVFSSERESAERELFAFAHRELAPDDRFSSAFFAGSGALAVPSTPISELNDPPTVPPDIDPAGTRLAPAVSALVQARSADDGCAARALIVITDGALGDAPDTLARTLTAANYTRLFAVIPSATGWSRPSALPDSFIVYHFHNGGWMDRAVSVFTGAEPLDVVFGNILGTLTGQHLVRNSGSTS